MNFHSDEWVMEQIRRHYLEAEKLYNDNNIIGVFCQGSTNYGLDTPNSDIDTKCILTPSFKDIVLNRKPISTTNVLDNEEHLDAKDVRLYMETFRKQNLNFLEILFTPYVILNPRYMNQWVRLVLKNEEIARMNPFRAVKSMKGIAMEKYHAMCHEYPSKVEIIKEHGYDGKQVSHLLRVEDYLKRYINDEPYKDCLMPSASLTPLLIDLKQQKIPFEQGQKMADEAIIRVTEMADKFCNGKVDEENQEMRELLEDVQYEIVKLSIQEELK